MYVCKNGIMTKIFDFKDEISSCYHVNLISLTLDLANEPAKTEEDLLEGAGKDLLQALEGVGTGAKQLAGQVIGQAVVTKTDEPEPDPPGPVEPARKSGVVTRATRSLKDILAERRRREQGGGAA